MRFSSDDNRICPKFEAKQLVVNEAEKRKVVKKELAPQRTKFLELETRQSRIRKMIEGDLKSIL